MHSINIKIKNKNVSFAIGLWWQILEGKATRKQLFSQATKLGEDFPDRHYNCIVSRKQQFGLGSSQDSKIKRLPSLACAILERSWPTWIGMFCLNSEQTIWWVCAISKKNIVAEGDQFFSSQKEAEKHLKSLKSMSSWDNNEILCESFEESLQHFKDLINISEKVQPLYPAPKNKLILLIVGGTALVIMSWLLIAQYQRQLAEEQLRIARLEESLRNKSKSQSTNATKYSFPKEWLNSALPSVFAAQFIETARNSKQYSQGWKLKSIVRNNTGIYKSWQHQKSAQFTLRPANSTIGQRSDIAEAKITFTENTKRPHQEPISKSEITAQLSELTRLLGAKLSLNWKQPEIKQINKNEKLISPWVIGKWKLSSLTSTIIISPQVFVELDTIPCLTLSKIDLTENKCTIGGLIYASY